MVHQDTTRTDVIDSLQEDSMLITKDFAMEFLPTQDRETQLISLARELSLGT